MRPSCCRAVVTPVTFPPLSRSDRLRAGFAVHAAPPSAVHRDQQLRQERDALQLTRVSNQPSVNTDAGTADTHAVLALADMPTEFAVTTEPVLSAEAAAVLDRPSIRSCTTRCTANQTGGINPAGHRVTGPWDKS